MALNDKRQLTAQDKQSIRKKSILGALVAGPLGGIMSGLSEKRRIEQAKKGR